MSLTMAKSMINPLDKNAPRFDTAKPEELPRFLAHVKELMIEAGIVDQQKQIETVCKYTDYQTEREWKALPSYSDGVWDDFRKELLLNYPDANEITEGTLRRLDQERRRS